MKKCKNCHNVIRDLQAGLRDFCSEDCKKVYRKAYQANLMKEKRQKYNANIINDREKVGFSDVSKSNPTAKPFYEAQKRGLRPNEVRIRYRNQKIILSVFPVEDSQYTFVKYSGICEQRHREVLDRWIKEGEIEKGYYYKSQENVEIGSQL